MPRSTQQFGTKGAELGRPLAAPLRNGIRELRARAGNVHYRPLYFFQRGVAVITHGCTKEGAVPAEEIDFAIACRDLVRADFDNYTTDWSD